MSDCVSRLIDVATAPPLNARFSKSARASATALNWSASRRSPILGEHGTGGLQTRGAQPNWAGIACSRAVGVRTLAWWATARPAHPSRAHRSSCARDL